MEQHSLSFRGGEVGQDLLHPSFRDRPWEDSSFWSQRHTWWWKQVDTVIRPTFLWSLHACYQLNPTTAREIGSGAIWFGYLSLSLPKSDQFNILPGTSPEILCHRVWWTWLFIAFSNERWFYYQFSQGWENVLFEWLAIIRPSVMSHFSFLWANIPGACGYGCPPWINGGGCTTFGEKTYFGCKNEVQYIDPIQMWCHNLWTGWQDKRKSSRCNEVYSHAKRNPIVLPSSSTNIPTNWHGQYSNTVLISHYFDIPRDMKNSLK